MNQSIANPMIANIGGSMMQGMQYGAQVQDMRRQNALRSVLQEVGPAIAAGDTNALARVYEVAPDVALELQRDMEVRQREATRFEREGVVNSRQDTEWEWQVKDRAAAMSAAERAAEAAQIEKGLSGAAFFYQNGDKAGYDGFLTQNGLDPASLPFEQFPAHAAQFGKALDILRGFEEAAAGPKPADEYQRYVQEEQEAGRQPLSRIDYAQAKKGEGVSMTMPDGTVVRVGGAAQQGRMDIKSPDAMLASIDGILDDDALDWSTGALSWTQVIPGTPMYRFGTRARQLNGQAFLQAFESLKGAGQITEIEGQKATEAVGRLATGQSPEDYRQALTELKTILETAKARAPGAVSGAQPAAPEAPPTESRTRDVEIDGVIYRVERLD